jgi:hypothetical protein
MKDQIWVKGNKEISGQWEYYWPSDMFIIQIKSKRFIVKGDKPEWSGMDGN